MNALLNADALANADYADRIVGVIDLCGGQAVHAIAGARSNYHHVAFCGGDPVALAAHYQTLGLSALYIADLDSIQNRELQAATIESLCHAACGREVVIDVGWTGNPSERKVRAIMSCAERFPNVRWVAATESLGGTKSLSEFADLLGSENVILGLDFRAGELITPDIALESWVARAVKLEIGGILVLDLASVGTRGGVATIETCRHVRELAPGQTLLSGGGIRSIEDMESLFEAGCDRCLVATALHG